MLLVSGGARPGLLLTILQCLGQLPTAKNHPAPNVSSAEVEISFLIRILRLALRSSLQSLRGGKLMFNGGHGISLVPGIGAG